MSRVNFVQQINMFMEFGKRNGLTSYERMFWLGLFHIANMWAQRNQNYEWPDDFFPVSNSEIEAWSGLEERNIRAIRNRFKQIGLVDFKKGDGRKSDPEYRIFYLHVNGYKIEPDTGDNGYKNAPDSVGDSVGDRVGDRVGDCVCEQSANGYKNAPDSVREPRNTTPSVPGSIYTINANGGTVNVNANETQGQERRRAPARDGFAINPSRRQSASGGFGFANLDGGTTESEGLVPLPWLQRG